MATNDFWGNLAGGMLSAGAGLYGQRQQSKADEERLRRAQGPLYDQMMEAAGQSMGLARGTDPKAMAAERFAAQQALVAPTNEAAMQKLQRELVAKGQMGIASHGAVPGTVSTGQAMNPQMAALLAAQEGAKQRSAYESLNEGEAYLDRLLGRGGMLQQSAQAGRASNLAALPAARPSTSSQIVGALGGLLKDPGTIKSIGGMLGGAADWLRGLGGGTSWNQAGGDFSMADLGGWQMPSFDFGSSSFLGGGDWWGI